MASLYELTEDFTKLLDMMQDPECDSNLISEVIAQISGEFDTKAENYCKVIKELEGKAMIFDKEIERLSNLKDSCVKNIANLKETLLKSMKMAEKDKIEGEIFKLSVRKCAPKVIIDSEESIPTEFIKTEMVTKVDKKSIGAYLKENPFASAPFAHLEENYSLIIK